MQSGVLVVVVLAVYTAPILSESLDHRFPFYNTDLSWDARVNDLVGRLTLEEIQDQLSKGGGSSQGGPAPGIDRLGIKHYQWWTGCNRGVVWAGEATSFPQAIGIAASFDPNLRYRVAEATAEELRVKHVQAMQQGTQDGHHGLSCFSPNVDVVLHPFWGRAQETHGECPYMGRVFADQFVRGLQGNHSRYIRANAGCKHFAVHAGPDQTHGNGPARNSFNAQVSMYDMRMTFLPAFRQCVESGSYSMMSSYNAINGVPVAANKWLLTDLLRTEWGFKGYVLADAGAIENLWWSFHYTNNAVDTVAASIKAGMNIETYNGHDTPLFEHIVEAVHQGKLTESMVRERVKPLFYTRMRLGEFDPPHLNPYSSLTMAVVESNAHQKLAVETAMKSFVLLKNNGVLPIKHRLNNIALVGPFSDERKNLDGDYAANTPGRYKTDVLDAMHHIANNVHMGKGCDNVKCENYNSGQVLNQLNNVDLIVVALGTGQDNEMEGHDRFTFDLPGHQRQLLGDVLSHAHGKPVVALLFTGTAVDMNWAHVDNRLSAIMQCWLPAQATGDALRHVLTNDMAGAVPAGRLPITWMKNSGQLGDIYDYSLTERTYRYFTGEPLYPFGYGLSYTTFHYSGLSFPHSINAGQDLHGHVTVRNTGSYDADEVVQVYISWQKNWGYDPNIQLAWFDRVWLPKNSQKTVSFTVESKTMALWMDNQWKIVPANMKLYVGGQQPHQQRAASSNVLEVTFDVNGNHNSQTLIG